MDRLGSGVRVSASFQIFALKMLLHSAGGELLPGAFSVGVYLRRSVSRELSPGLDGNTCKLQH